jgi:site-specific DNA-cytosine methylase
MFDTSGMAATPSTSSPAGSPVREPRRLGSGTGSTIPRLFCGERWPEPLASFDPATSLVENVANLLAIHDGAVWGEVLGDLASFGYDVVWDCLPAAAVGAPHGRDRVFAVARHAEHCGRGPGERDLRARQSDAEGCVDVVADASRQPERAQNGQADAEPGGGRAWPLPLVGGHAAAADAEREPPNYDEDPQQFEARRLAVAERLGNSNGIGTPLPIALKLLPTPTEGDSRNSRNSTANSGQGSTGNSGTTLSDVAYEWSGASTSPQSDAGKQSTGLRLNPSFVEWMMGTPSCGECGLGWTDPDCPHSATAYTSTSAGSSASTSSASSESD